MIASLALLAAFFAANEEGSLAGVFNSPFIVPVFGTIMILGIVVAGIWSGVRTREMRSQERLAAIAKGLQPEPTWEGQLLRTAVTHATGDVVRLNDGSGARRTGIVLVSVGVGLCLFFAALTAILRDRDVLSGAATGLIPLAIGVGFLVDGRLRRAEFYRLQATGAMPAAGLGSTARPDSIISGQASGQAAGQAAAPGTELRPLH